MRERVRLDWVADLEATRLNQRVRELRERYNIVVEEAGGAMTQAGGLVVLLALAGASPISALGDELASRAAATTPTPFPTHDVDVTSVARVYLDQIVDTQVSPIIDLRGVLPERCTPIGTEAAGVLVSAGFAFECASELTFDDALQLPWSLAGVVALMRWGDGTEASAYFRGDGRSVPIRLADCAPEGGTTGRLPWCGCWRAPACRAQSTPGLWPGLDAPPCTCPRSGPRG